MSSAVEVIEALKAHLIEHEGEYQNLLNHAKQIIENSLRKNGIEHLPILARLKSIESACRKAETKSYDDAKSEITDIVGIRVVVLIESDIQKATEIISDLFTVDKANSIDKKTELRPNQFGYSSMHIICSLGSARASIPEYAGLCDILFEVQIRSALQHTWAEIEHKRRYKGENALPADLERRLNAASATLELVDREFSEISRLAEEYKASVVSEKAKSLSDPITKIALEALLARALIEAGHSGELTANSDTAGRDVSDELRKFGVLNVKGILELLEKDASKRVIREYERQAGPLFRPGLMFYRMLMLANDADYYLSKCRSLQVPGISERSVSVLERIPTAKDIRKVAHRNGVPIVEDPVFLPHTRRKRRKMPQIEKD